MQNKRMTWRLAFTWFIISFYNKSDRSFLKKNLEHFNGSFSEVKEQ